MKNFILAGIFFILVSVMNFANAAEIDRVFYFGNPDVSYPLVIVKNTDASLKINQEIRAEIKRLVDEVNNRMIEGNFESVTVNVDYQIPCNHENGILSIVLTEYVNFEGSAHPSTYQRTLNFNSDSGVRLLASGLTEIAKKETDYTLPDITKKLQAYAKKNNIVLFDEAQQLTAIPEDFYFDDNLHVHFLFQQYEVAPYAAGIIDLDADAKY